MPSSKPTFLQNHNKSPKVIAPLGILLFYQRISIRLNFSHKAEMEMLMGLLGDGS